MAPRPAPAPTDDFAAFHRRTFARVWGILGRAGIRRPAERCEVAQEVYVVAHLKLASRNPAVPELAWLGAIAWNVGRRYVALHRTQKEQPMDDPESQAETAVDDGSPEDLVGRRRRYFDLVKGVSDDRRVVFEMHEVEGHSLSAIAGALLLPLGTVTTRLRLAREDIAAALSRMEAREARAEGRSAAMLLPFGAGAWYPMSELFDDAPPGMERQAWRGFGRALARSGAAGGLKGGATAGGMGAGFALGAGTVGAVVLALRLLGPTKAPAPEISRAPEALSAVPVAVAPTVALTATATASAEPGSAAPPAPPRGATAASAATSVPASGLADHIDPEEERILAKGEAAFTRGKVGAARDALDEHARRFPPGRAKLAAESAHLRARLDGLAGPSATTTTSAAPDGGRAPHRLMDVDE
jgi:RNA polymerase sigma-70 factor (ECF subfamily)